MLNWAKCIKAQLYIKNIDFTLYVFDVKITIGLYRIVL